MLHALSVRLCTALIVLAVIVGFMFWQMSFRTDYDKLCDLMYLSESIQDEHITFDREKAIKRLCAESANRTFCEKRLEN